MKIISHRNSLVALALLSLTIILILFIWLGTNKTHAPNDGIFPITDNEHHYGVSAGSPLAVDVGMKVLENGGNAVDAAIAVSYALGVVQPYGSGIGGGGAMLIYPNDKEPPTFYDYQGVSPASGEVPQGYAAVPGFVLAMEQIHNDFGSVSMGKLIKPSIKLAEDGFRVDAAFGKIIAVSKQKLFNSKSSIYYNYGALPGEGMLLKQPELALTLRQIEAEGSFAFYKGEIAKTIVDSVKGLALSDLSDYTVKRSTPVSAKYGEYEVVSAPPPFGGITLIQILMMADKMKIRNLETDAGNLETINYIINAVYSKRLKTIADPQFSVIDNDKLVSSEFIDQMILDLKKNQSYISTDNEDTTHFVVIDKNGMMVSCTNSLSSLFGSGIYTGGFFLNNHLKNFSKDTKSLNRWEAGKRPRSYMSPTIIAFDGHPVLGIGTPGGNRIPTFLAQILINILKNGEDPQTAIDAPRFYIRGTSIIYEPTLSDKLLTNLKKNGISVTYDRSFLNFGAVNCLYYEPATGTIQGGADHRRGGSWSSK